MAYDYHRRKSEYFEHQRRVTEEHVLPFIEERWRLPPGARVLEIGCGEAGVLKAFLERGCQCVGVDLNKSRLARGREFGAQWLASGQLQLILGDIYAPEVQSQLGKFDLIVLKDVIEHIDNQANLLVKLKDYLHPGGCIFFGFPPWRMPFGGHQQACKSKLLSRAAYIHLLPASIYHRILKELGESDVRINALMRNKRTGITIERFEAIARDTGYETVARRLYLLNPIYSYRFDLPTKEQLGLVSKLPYLREFVSTCAYYLVRPATPPPQ